MKLSPVKIPILVSLLAIFGLLSGARTARAQTALGSQRVGTSMGAFLKIGVGPRAVGMGGAFTPVADDISAVYWNPGGLARIQKKSFFFTYAALPADLDYHFAAAGFPNFLGGTVAFQMGSIYTTMEETTELYPDGTGREFSYSDFLAGVSYSRMFTDKLSIGLSFKYVNESLGEEVGGGKVRTWVGDVGTIYDIGVYGAVLAVTLANFGPNWQPDGEYTSYANNEVIAGDNEFESYTPANTFRFGVSAKPQEIMRGHLQVALEFVRPEDNNETIRTGLELKVIDDRLALRTGYDFNADTMKFAAGLGLRGNLGPSEFWVDYAYTDSDYLGRVDRVSLTVNF